MGCSSSSAQTVEQEKRPGTKPEESSGETGAVRNVIDTEDAQTIEDQMQLPVQTALPEDLQPGGDDEAEAVLVALKAQEVLSSGVDFLPDLKPQLVPVNMADSTLEAATPTEASTEPEAAVVVVEDVVEEPAPVETVVEATPEVKALVKAIEDAPSVEPVVAVQADANAVVEEMTAVIAGTSPEVATPAIEPVTPESTEATVVEEEAAALGTEAPVKVAAVEAEAPNDNAAVVTASTALCESSEPTKDAAPPLSDVSALGESAVPVEGVLVDEVLAPCHVSAPLQVEEPVIDTKIAVATIPEMPPLSPVTLKAQDEPQLVVEDATITPLAPVDTSPRAKAILAPAPENESVVAVLVQGADVPASTEADSETSSDVPAVSVTSEPVVESTALTGSPVVVSSIAASATPSGPAPGLSLKVVATEALQDIQREKAKKED